METSGQDERLRHTLEWSANRLRGQLSARRQFVYAVRSGPFVKIGIASDISKRLSALQTGSPNRIEFLGMLPTLRPKEDERSLHAEFKEFRKIGEWFELPEFRLKKLLSILCFTP
jgi:hypothetical protein